ncbi:MAG: hypothetical protein DWQ07_06680 [Chloroflexi bacterium]|nr:MAG: hypothetical protein DWQ07_06680 [Chloroflexota bacterium]MBL1195615.1 hypothetical protein [Chloroflexota bacterium]NOH12903.1 hypothetical protein [Chloroflexota bacterium]
MFELIADLNASNDPVLEVVIFVISIGVSLAISIAKIMYRENKQAQKNAPEVTNPDESEEAMQLQRLIEGYEKERALKSSDPKEE